MQQVLTYRYKLKPSRKQYQELTKILISQRNLYNAALEQRIAAYKTCSKTLGYYDQLHELTELRKDNEFKDIPLKLQRGTLKRLDEAYKGFFRRVKAGAKPGFPRFKGEGWFSSFSFAEFSGIKLIGKKLYFKGITGGLRVSFHRELPEGKILTCQLKRTYKGWFVCFQIRTNCCTEHNGEAIGLDVGLKNLATLSTGEEIPNPYYFKHHEKELRRKQRALSRCTKGSKRRSKVKKKVAALYAKIANTRHAYLHQQSAKLTKQYKIIAVEKLNINRMTQGNLAKPIYDTGWSMFKQMLIYKALKAGGQVIEVDPNGTTQCCSGCGEIVPKKLNERWHKCSGCGLSLGLDHNAAINILHRAVLSPEKYNWRGLSASASGIVI